LSVTVNIDPRIELMSVLQVLDGSFLSTQFDIEYRADVLMHFGMYAGHPVLKTYRRMSQAGFAFDAVPKAMMTRADPPGLVPRVPYPPDVLKRAGGAENLDRFFAELSDFARKSGFDVFSRRNARMYMALAKAVTPAAKLAASQVEDYSGMQVKNSNIIIGPLLHNGGFSSTLENDATTEVYVFVGPSGAREGLADFGSAEQIAEIVQHELCHSFVNPLARAHLDKLNQYSAAFESVQVMMAQRAYGDWEHTANEMIIRAIVARLMAQRHGEEAGAGQVAREEGEGFRYVRPLANLLKEYEANRQLFPSFSHFYLKLLVLCRINN